MSKQEMVKANLSMRENDLVRLQALPLEQKILLTERRIQQFSTMMQGRIYIAFSGGKDSTVLLNIARRIIPNIKACFIDTGLEYPEIRDFVKTIENVDWIKPEKTFKEVIDTEGYPIGSKEIAQAIKEIHTTKSDKLKEKRLKQLGNKWLFLLSAPFKISDTCCIILKKNPAKNMKKKPCCILY